MRNDEAARCGRELAHPPGLREPAHPPDVRLDDGDPGRDQVRELVPRREPLALCDANGRAPLQLGVAGEVVDPQRRLEEEDVELRERLATPQCTLDRVEGVLHVDHERHLGPDRLPHCGHDLDHLRVVAVEPLVDIRAREGGFALRRAKAELLGAHAPADHRLDIRVERRDLRLERRVGRQRVGARIRPELPARLAGRLSADVPQRDVERADRVDAAAPPAGHRGADVEVFPDRLRVERVAADQLLLEPAVHGVRRRRLDERARHPGVQIGFADPDEALVGDHLDDDRVLRRARRVGVIPRIEQDVRSDVDDLHACIRRRATEEEISARLESARSCDAIAACSSTSTKRPPGPAGSSKTPSTTFGSGPEQIPPQLLVGIHLERAVLAPGGRCEASPTHPASHRPPSRRSTVSRRPSPRCP